MGDRVGLGGYGMGSEVRETSGGGRGRGGVHGLV